MKLNIENYLNILAILSKYFAILGLWNWSLVLKPQPIKGAKLKTEHAWNPGQTPAIILFQIENGKLIDKNDKFIVSFSR